MKAIISVSDKTGIQKFAQGLRELGVNLYSTGGTQKVLEEAHIAVKGISELTGFPEIMDGRVKTLHPAVHGGILARRDLASHLSQATAHKIELIDMVVVNLYPFVQRVEKEGVTEEEAIENIDIGGPTMIRAAAKNFTYVMVIVDPADYDWVLQKMTGPGLSIAERKRLAQKAFQHVAFYDTVIAQYLRGTDELFPQELTLAFRRQQILRYGENPHQKGALYREPLVKYSSLVLGEQLLGQHPSLCNYYDLSAALETVRDFPEQPAAVVIKHATPSGFAMAPTLAEALEKAIHADATSAFGGIIGLNRAVDTATAKVIGAFKELEASNIDAIVAPGAEEAAVALLKATRRRMILFTVPSLEPLPVGSMNFRHLPGGILVQEANIRPVDPSQWRVATKVAPSKVQLGHMRDAWVLLRHIRSNTILVWDGAREVTLGIGSGQVSRVGAAKLALEQAGERAKGAILASDSFFPFGDTVGLAARYGIGAIVQQGGSINDQASIDAADAAGIPMVLTGERAFWH